MEEEALSPASPPTRKGGRPKAPRCNECRSCQNRHWNLSCEKKDLLESLAARRVEAESSSSSSSSSVQADEPVVDRSEAEVLRVETLGNDTELRRHLALLLQLPLGQIGRIRMTTDKQPALIDVISIVTRKNKNDSAEVWRTVSSQSLEVKENILHLHFPGKGQRATPVSRDLKTLIQVIFMLPGREASLVRQAAAEIFIRFMGGDLSLIQDVQRMNEVQAFLRENDPEHPMRVFGEAVESAPSTEFSPASQTPRVPPNPVIMKVEDSIGLPGSDHLYAASRLEDNILKVGVSKDVVERMPELSRSFQSGYTLQAVWPGEAALEEIVLEKLKPYRASVGNSREHFDARVSLEYLCQIVDHARALYKTKMELASTSFEQRKRELEFQEDLKDRALKRRREELELEEKLAQEQLLRKLASDIHPEAMKVFLERLAR
jgi:hypothetical protein